MIPISRVMQAVRFLEESGFTKVQVRNALPLLLYPVNLIGQHLEEMALEAGENWAEDSRGDSVLQLCLYFTEKEFDFTLDGMWSGIQVNFSEALYKELEEVTGYQRPLLLQAQRKPPVPSEQSQDHSSWPPSEGLLSVEKHHHSPCRQLSASPPPSSCLGPKLFT